MPRALPPWLVSPAKEPVKAATVARRAAEVEARRAATAAGAAAAEAAIRLHQGGYAHLIGAGEPAGTQTGSFCRP